MVVSVFADGTKRDKIAEFYDTHYPTAFMRGVLEESKEDEEDVQMMIVCRHDKGVKE